MRSLEWQATARFELLSILDYISDDDPDAAQRLKDLIESQADTLLEFPNRHRAGRVPGTREMVVHPNYLIIYAVTPQAVKIVRILHAAQQWPEV
ncbi:type II toxin-antitoxin system RelE/ParE family toxin [Asticcacaulis sp. YBE204]|uniref:type II toxin-antitoxin system RelE/ParE family toxin n=1 Tax=Asticcacaulis sp. YBE204 TaxID=1282363 RepID=UPI0003C403BD|nr:type II toxin-antitoxin system RelE/ParE family toxin [Asticcacaulis sp. YBE204]ESQ80096.1 hypothetical protein AEYBE204_05620 [Asticcacaulis sp. YBE204]